MNFIEKLAVNPDVSRQELKTWYKYETMLKSKPDFCLCGELVEGELITAAGIFTLQDMWGLSTTPYSFPAWVLGTVRSLSSVRGKTRGLENESLIYPGMKRMEALGLSTWYMCRRISKSVNWSNVGIWLERKHLAIGRIDRYRASLQELISSVKEIESVHPWYRRMLPLEWDDNRYNIGVIRHDLKYEYRT